MPLELSAEIIESADDPRVADFREFKDPDYRRRRALFAVEGRESFRVLRHVDRFEVHALLATPPALESLRDVVDDGTRVYVAESAVLRRIAGVRFHQGCVALARRPPEPAFEGLLEETAAHLVLALEDVTDPDNIGGLFRNAFVFGVDAVVLSPRCSDPLYRKAIRTSIGSTLRVRFARAPDWAAALEGLGCRGFERVALTPALEAEPLERARFGPRVALVVGNEGEGLSRTALEATDRRVRIGMVEGADSLNVATASGIALHHVRIGR